MKKLQFQNGTQNWYFIIDKNAEAYRHRASIEISIMQENTIDSTDYYI